MPKPKPQPGKPKRAKRPPKNTCTALMVIEPSQKPQNKKPTPRPFIRMNLMLRTLEKTGGNILKAEALCGISRRSHYRWMKGDTPARRRYQRKAEAIFRADLISVKAAGVVDNHLDDNNLQAAMFTLNMRGQKHGWSREQIDPATISAAVLDKLMAQVNAIVKPDMPESEKQLWIRDIAANAGVPERDLQRRLKVLELSK